MTTTSTQTKKENPGTRGVNVEVHEDGTLKLYKNPINEKTLVKRLIKEESAHKGRAIILQAKGTVRRDDLVKLREYLIANRIPNVVIVTPVSAYSYNEDPQNIKTLETETARPSTANQPPDAAH